MLATKIVSEDGISYNLTPLGYVVLIAVVIVVLAVGFIVKDKKTHSVKRLVTSAMAIALATLTSFITIFKMPMGGSVTLFSMLFIVLIGYWYGISAGMTASIAYGVLQLIVNPYIISLPQMFLDYIFAFGALGLSGIFANSKNGLVKGYIAGIAGRFFFSFLSGWIFFAVYTPEFFNSAVLYSLAYNAAYIGAEGITHSDMGGVRFAYERDLDSYIAGELRLSEMEEIPPLDRDLEYIMLSLRTAQGIGSKYFERQFRQKFQPMEDLLVQYEAHGFAARTEKGWRLTPRGFFVSNAIIVSLQEAVGRERQRKLCRAAEGDFTVDV